MKPQNSVIRNPFSPLALSADKPGSTTRSKLLACALIAAVSVAAPQSALATNLYWDVNAAATGATNSTTAAGTWGTGILWNTDSTGGGGTFTATTTLDDDLTFSAGTNATGNFTVTLSGARQARSIVIEEGNQLTLAGTSTPSLTIGSGGITVTNAARFTAPSSLPSYLLAASQTWTDNSSNVGSAFVTSSLATIAGVDGSGNITLTLDGTHAVNTDGSTIRGFIADGTGNTLSLVKNGTGIWQLYGGAANTNTYSGGTTLNAGELQVNCVTTFAGTTSALGTGGLQINGGTLTARNGNKTIANTVTVGGDFTLNGANAGGNVLTLSGNVDLGGGTRTIAVNATPGAAIISGVISNGGLTKSGTRNLTLEAANTYTGPTTITDGTLTLTNPTPIDSSSGVSINGSGAKLVSIGFGTVVPAITLTQGSVDGDGVFNSLTVADAIGNAIAAGAGAPVPLQVNTLTFQGAATLNLRASGTVSDQYLTITNLTTSAAADVVINATNTAGVWTSGTDYPLIEFDNYTSAGDASHFTLGTVAGLNPTQTAELVNTGSAIVLRVAAESLIWTGLQSADWTTQTVGGLRNWSHNGSGVEFTTNSAVTFDDTAARFEINLAENVSPSAVVVDNGFFSDYTISSTGGFGIQTGALAKSGDGALILTTNNAYTGPTTINAGLLELTGAGSIAASSSISNNGLLVLNPTGGPNVYPNPIGGTGSLSKEGSAPLTLAGANTFTGAFTLEGGALNINSATAVGEGPGAFVLNGGSIDNTSGSAIASASTKPQTWNADVLFTGSSSLEMGTGTVTVSGADAVRTVTISNGTLAVGELKAPLHGLTKEGPGTVAFASTGAGGASSVIAGTLTVNGGTVQICRTGADAAGSGDFTAAGLSGSGTVVNGAATERWLFVNNTDTHTFSGTLANGGTGALGLNKLGTGTLNLTTANSYTGATTVAAGYLNVQNGSALGGSTVSVRTLTGGLQLQGGVTLANNFLTSNDGSGASGYAIANLSGNNTITGTISLTDGAGPTAVQSDAGALTLSGNITNVIAANRILILEGASTGANIVSGVISNGVTGTTSVTKNDAGTWTLSGTNAYTGPTTVNAGTLLITGNAAGATGAVIVNNGSTLGGTGALGGSLTVDAGGHQAFSVAATPGAQVARTISGALTLTAGNVLDLTAATTPADGSYTLLTANGGITGSATTVNLNGIDGVVSVAGNSLVLTVGASGYDSWAASQGLTEANKGPDLDPELDGIANLLEFVLGGEPLASDPSILPDLAVTSSDFVFTFTRSDESEAEAALAFQFGSTLAGWTNVTIGTVSAGPVTVTENGTAPDSVVVTIPRTSAVGGKLFGRLNATTP